MNIRCQCVEILQKIIAEKTFFNGLKNQITEKDGSFANMLILTVLRQFANLKEIIASLVVKKFTTKNAVLEYILMCAASEILYLKTPDYAVLNEYVSIARKKCGRYAGGMVNAVLRKIAADAEQLRRQYSKPRFLPAYAKLLQQDYNSVQIENMALQSAEEPPLDISVKQNHAVWAEKLNGVLFANGTIRLQHPKGKISSLPGYKEGQWWVQDLAASLPVLLVGNVQGKKVLDLCAAPGGKTAQMLAAGAKVTAVDIDPVRMERLQTNINRLGLSQNLQTAVSDGTAFLQKCGSEFDLIILDVPCSATGTFRRHPEILCLKGAEDARQQSLAQKQMLEAVAAVLKPEALLLYCTCSIAKMEGEEQIAHFLASHTEFELLPAQIEKINRYDGKKLPQNLIDKGVLRTLPYDIHDDGGMDAFFAAVLKRKSTSKAE